jgi:hypothetical protein
MTYRRLLLNHRRKLIKLILFIPLLFFFSLFFFHKLPELPIESKPVAGKLVDQSIESFNVLAAPRDEERPGEFFFIKFYKI